MAKAVEGAVMIGGVAAAFAVAPYLASTALIAFVTSATGAALLSGIGLMGVGMEISALGDLLKGGPTSAVASRQSAQPYRVIYGLSRVGGTLAFESTTGHQLNHVWIWASHQCQSIDAIYLDHKQVFWSGAQGGNWGDSQSLTFTNEEGNQYNFGGLVFVEHRYGYPGQLVRDSSGHLAPSPHFQSLEGNDGKWSAGHDLMGHCCSYVKCTASSDQFPGGQPSVKATIEGKNDILDPRTGLRGYTVNSALIVADFMTNTDFGMGMSWDEIDLDELIASANVCDEIRPLANGQAEYRYSTNGTFTTDASRGDILSSLLDAMAGRIAFVGGKHKIIAGYDRGASLQFGEDDFTGDVQWSSRRSFRGLFNEVQPVFTCPRFPYQVVGNLVGPDTPEQGTFDGAWQPVSAPPYSLSSGRGYLQYPLTDFEGNPIYTVNPDGSQGAQELGDAYMAEDNGQRLTSDLKLQFVISCVQSQVLGRIKLLRHRNQGSGTLPLKLSGLKTSALDNILVSYAPFGWVNRELEVAAWRFVPKQSSDGKAVLFETEIDVVDTDPAATYAWTTEDEIALNAPDYLTIQDAAQVENPTDLVLESGYDSAVITTDGIVHPRIKATWTAPSDPLITSGGYITLQYSAAADGIWHNGPLLPGGTTLCMIPNVVQGQPYNVRIRAVRSNGATGAWLNAGPHVVSETNSVITTGSLAPNSPANTSDNSTIDSIVESAAATIRIYGPGGDGSSWLRYVGANTVTVNGAHITGLAFSTVYFVVYDVVAGVFYALSNYPATLADDYYYLGACTTCTVDYNGTGGGGTGGGGTTGGGGDPGGGGRNPGPLPE